MYRFWEQVVKPVLLVARPTVIVEASSLHSRITAKLLDYARHCGASVVAACRQPPADFALLQRVYEQELEWIAHPVPEALKYLDTCDCLLLDDAPNWYSVHRTLELTEEMANRTGRFPIIFVHDTQWPYGRRDMYPCPSDIPEASRQPYACTGVVLGQQELAKGEEGQFGGHYHAQHEYGACNGVLTAIEDYLLETDRKLHWFQLMSHQGLGIIVPEGNPAVGIMRYLCNTSGM